MSRLKIDIHNHILPESWPDLKEVSRELVNRWREVIIISRSRTALRLRRMDTASSSLQGTIRRSKSRRASIGSSFLAGKIENDERRPTFSRRRRQLLVTRSANRRNERNGYENRMQSAVIVREPRPSINITTVFIFCRQVLLFKRYQQFLLCLATGYTCAVKCR